MKKLVLAAAVALALAPVAGCNAGAIALVAYAQRSLDTTTVSGTLTNAPANARIGYVTWVEVLQDGTTQGKLNFDLVRDKDVSFDQWAKPDANGHFQLTIQPKPNVVEGTYVVFAWDDSNGNNAYEGDQGEKRAQEVYRVRGQAGPRSAWTAEQFIFTDKKLSIQYAAQDALPFTF